MIVTPDASVLLKWVLPGDDEQDTDAALSLRDEAVAGILDLIVPQLWIYEVGNTLARRFPDDADALLSSLADFGLAEARLDSNWRRRAVSLSVTYGVAFYDAAYHAVALGLGGVFVTADERYVRRASRAGSISSLRLWRSRRGDVHDVSAPK
ncbi:MAG: type II toxin-antitoxin system VapC family toxin [Gemmatimonadales bacterium]|nr:type II toxin-antitoxin system VapC family toxin [Gemmatimonadales bacterium]MYH11054.1 type II toxin-antitoxin system VapC family toxin [Gemmatimonadales bacterium]MYL05508.1 type II toxin-antitoxin system VapC family toxin [Gemmatimonadales bacterium]